MRPETMELHGSLWTQCMCMRLQLAAMVGDTERLVARIAVAEAARDASARQLAALKGQLAAEHAARAQLQADAALQVRTGSSSCAACGCTRCDARCRHCVAGAV
jgi:hypothetical protein